MFGMNYTTAAFPRDPEVLRSRCFIQSHEAYYLQFLAGQYQPYFSLDAQQRAALKELIRQHYMDWLNLNEAALSNETVLSEIVDFLRVQQKAAYFDSVREQIRLALKTQTNNRSIFKRDGEYIEMNTLTLQYESYKSNSEYIAVMNRYVRELPERVDKILATASVLKLTA